MHKSELIRLLAHRLDLDATLVQRVMDMSFDLMVEILSDGDKILLSSFGTLYVKERKARRCYHPGTKKVQLRPACKTVCFRPSQRLRALLND